MCCVGWVVWVRVLSGVGWCEIWHVLCRVGGVGSGTFCCGLVRDVACVVLGGWCGFWYFLL
jgi:hypothetical protein